MKRLFLSFFSILILGLGSTVNAQEDCNSEFEICGSFFKVYCDGTVDVNLSENVTRYKVFNFGDVITDRRNDNADTDDDVITDFNSGLFGKIEKEDNFWAQIYTPCGVETINFSELLECYCADFSDFLIETPTNNFISNSENEVDFNAEVGSVGNTVENINAYPNPAVSEIYVDLPLIKDQYTLQVYDLNGRLISTSLSQGGTEVIDLEKMETGLYILNVQSVDFNYSEKIQLIK